MQEHLVSTRKLSDRPKLVASVNRSELRRLGDANRARFVRVQFGLPGDDCLRCADVDLSTGATS